MTEDDMEDLVRYVGEMVRKWKSGSVSGVEFAEGISQLYDRLTENEDDES